MSRAVFSTAKASVERRSFMEYLFSVSGYREQWRG